MPDILFLCTGNSARSILAEVLLNHLGGGVWRASSAGSNPVGRVNPHALSLLAARGHDVSGLSSKRWDIFAGPDARPIDVIITLCDSAAGEACPVWPGHPITSHWGMPDPAAVEADAGGSDAAPAAAFASTYDTLHRRLSALVALSPDVLARPDARAVLDRIGRG